MGCLVATGYLALDVILQVEVLVERPVDEFGEKNLTSVVGVNLKKRSLGLSNHRRLIHRLFNQL